MRIRRPTLWFFPTLLIWVLLPWTPPTVAFPVRRNKGGRWSIRRCPNTYSTPTTQHELTPASRRRFSPYTTPNLPYRKARGSTRLLTFQWAVTATTRYPPRFLFWFLPILQLPKLMARRLLTRREPCRRFPLPRQLSTLLMGCHPTYDGRVCHSSWHIPTTPLQLPPPT